MELALLIVGVAVPIVFKIVDFTIDKFFPNSTADNITDVIEPFVNMMDTVQEHPAEKAVTGVTKVLDDLIE